MKALFIIYGVLIIVAFLLGLNASGPVGGFVAAGATGGLLFWPLIIGIGIVIGYRSTKQ